MNTTALGKALKLACLPTLSLLILLFFGFFSISKTISFISSDDGVAIFLRIIAFLAEVILIAIMYKKYKKEEVLKGNTTPNNKRELRSSKSLYEIKSNWSNSDNFKVYDTEDSNIVYVQRTPYSSDY